MSRRTSLADLVAAPDPVVTEIPETPDNAHLSVHPAMHSERDIAVLDGGQNRTETGTVAPRQRAPRKAKPEPAPAVEAVPKYLRMERKEARLHVDQVDALAAVVRRLNRGRQHRGSGERITENSLIRVAVDLLLDRADDLAGVSEADLLVSVGLAPRD